MRCPKCGYNSFDHLDSCKKCGKDLESFKQQYGIKSVLFPGQMQPLVTAAETEPESVSVAETVAAAAATTAAAAAVADTAVAEESDVPAAGEGDDFGFDFMGESEAEDDLSFDELFEEAPVDEDVEETLPEPEQEQQEQGEAAEAEDDFAFDMGREEGEKDALPAEEQLDDDFGFDIDDTEDEKPADDLSVADFDLPPAEEEDIFSEDGDVFEDADDKVSGTKEDPKGPFDLPGSPQPEEIPGHTSELSAHAATGLRTEDLPVAESVGEGETVSAPATASSVLQETMQEPVGEESSATEAEEPAAEESEARPTVLFAGKYPSAEALLAEQIEDSEDAEFAASEVPGDAESAAITADSTDVAATPPESASVSVVASAPPVDELLPPVASRVFAFACDLLLLVIVGTSFVVAAEAAMAGGGDNLFPSFETLLDLAIPYFLVLFSLAFGYFTLFHFLTGQTPGKMLTGLRVETLEGESLVFSQAFLRSVGGLLQLLPAGLGYLVILTSADRRGWNDQLAGTRLINLKQLPREA